MNLSRLRYYASQWAFVDVMKQASPFWLVGGREGETYEKDADGYPIMRPDQKAATLVFRNVDGRYPGGVYTLQYEGTGNVTVGLDARFVERTAQGGLVAVEPSDHGIEVQISDSDPDDPVRDIRLIMPGFADSASEHPFHPLFVERLSPFSVIRFMDWGRINGSEVQRWEDRSLPTDSTQHGAAGVAVEYMVQLCNEVKADIWLCIPHLADNIYVENLARLVRDQLDASLQVYIEYSNEVWNPSFRQGKWIRRRAEELNREWYELYVDRSVEIFESFEEVFGSTERLVRVVGAQTVNTWLGERLVESLPGRDSADVLAIAPYFDLQKETYERDLSDAMPAELYESCDANIDAVLEKVRTYRKLAEAAGLRLAAYEGGPHLVASGRHRASDETIHVLREFNLHPLMGTLYEKMLTGWAEAGGELFLAYNYVERPRQSGTWGALFYQDQPTEEAPKYQALVTMQKQWSAQPDKSPPAVPGPVSESSSSP